MVNDVADKVRDILGAVEQRFGIKFGETMTGGGCMALEARLESGHWIVATDEGLCGFRERLTFEAEADPDDGRRPLGWMIGIYPDGGDDVCWLSGEDPIIDVFDGDAFGEALPDVIGIALAQLASERK